MPFLNMPRPFNGNRNRYGKFGGMGGGTFPTPSGGGISLDDDDELPQDKGGVNKFELDEEDNPSWEVPKEEVNLGDDTQDSYGQVVNKEPFSYPNREAKVTSPTKYRDQYSKMLMEGPGKSKWGGLRAAGVAFLADLGSSSPYANRIPPQQIAEWMENARHPGWKDKVARAGAAAGMEEKGELAKDKEEDRKDRNRIREESIQARKDKADQDREARKLFEEAKREKETKELLQKYEKDGWVELVDEEDPRWGRADLEGKKELDLGGKKVKLVKLPKSEREGDGEIPDNVRKYYTEKGVKVPEGKVSKAIIQEWGRNYDRDLDKSSADSRIKAQQQHEANMLSRSNSLAEGREERAAKREMSQNRAKQDSTLNRLNFYYQKQLNDLEKEWKKNPDLKEQNPWENKDFLAKRKQIQDEWVDKKNETYSAYGNPHVDPYLDPKTGKPLSEEGAKPVTVTAPQGGSKKLTDPNKAKEYLQRAGGDKEKARALAKAEGWEL